MLSFEITDFYATYSLYYNGERVILDKFLCLFYEREKKHEHLNASLKTEQDLSKSFAHIP